MGDSTQVDRIEGRIKHLDDDHGLLGKQAVLDVIEGVREEENEAYSPDIESREDYYSRIETSVDQIEERLADEPTADVVELVDTEADTSRVAMYAHEALAALQHSSNRPGEWQHFVRDEGEWSDVITAMGYSLYRVDLWDEINRRDIET